MVFKPQAKDKHIPPHSEAFMLPSPSPSDRTFMWQTSRHNLHWVAASPDPRSPLLPLEGQGPMSGVWCSVTSCWLCFLCSPVPKSRAPPESALLTGTALNGEKAVCSHQFIFCIDVSRIEKKSLPLQDQLFYLTHRGIFYMQFFMESVMFLMSK